MAAKRPEDLLLVCAKSVTQKAGPPLAALASG